MYIYANDAMLA